MGWVAAQDSLALCPGDSALLDNCADAANAALGGVAYETIFQQGHNLTEEQALSFPKPCEIACVFALFIFRANPC